MKVLILFQAYPRDGVLDNKIAERLRGYGHDVRIGNIVSSSRSDMIQFEPHVVVIPEARCEYTRDYAQLMRQWDVKTVIRRTEPGYAKDDDRSDMHKQFCIGNWEYYSDLEITWCEDFADILKANNNVLGKNVKAAGAFAFDPYFPRPKKHRTSKPMALFVSIWDYADRRPDYCVPELPYGHPAQSEKYWLCREGRDKWIAEIDRCLKKYPNWNICLKVHPAEHPFEYQRVFGDRLKIYHTEAAVDVLPHASVLIHAGSTMAVEAHLLGIPAIQFCNFNETLVDKISPRVDSVDLKSIKLNKSNADTKIIKELEETFYGPIDGKACERAADYINEIKPGKPNIPLKWPKPTTTYETPGTFRYLDWQFAPLDVAQCVGCRNLLYMKPDIKLTKCPWCSIALCR
jgi:hypothetical protein